MSATLDYWKECISNAMAALIVNPSGMNKDTFRDVIAGAYQYADAMLAERLR